MSKPTELDKAQVYLVPVAHLDLADEPKHVHLSLYSWQERIGAWVTQTGLCGRSTTQGALPEGTEVTCPGCLKWRPVYEQTVASRYLAACDGELERAEPEGLRWWRADR